LPGTAFEQLRLILIRTAACSPPGHTARMLKAGSMHY